MRASTLTGNGMAKIKRGIQRHYISTLRRWVRDEGFYTSTKEAAIDQGLKEIEYLCETHIPSLDKDTPPSD